jgi:ABC-type sugar transport system substrate-binding protein
MPMKKLSFLVSLITDDNDYQLEQASAAEETARRLGIDIKVIYAANDPINQSQQLLKVIQSSDAPHPDAILFEPIGGTALPHVARASVTAGIGWVVLNREADYLPELRRCGSVPAFSVSADHQEIGRIQGQHLAAFLPDGGTALYIQGPSASSVSRLRTHGMEQAKPKNVKLIILKGQWTEDSAYNAVCSWMRLSTSQKLPIDMIACQNDDMAMGARKALREMSVEAARDKWAGLPFTGCDGLPNTGQKYVRSHFLAATIIVRAITTVASEKLVQGFQTGAQPPELVLTAPISFPTLDELLSRRPEKIQAPAV